jgi:CHASE2 domain-containing sensor protein
MSKQQPVGQVRSHEELRARYANLHRRTRTNMYVGAGGVLLCLVALTCLVIFSVQAETVEWWVWVIPAVALPSCTYGLVKDYRWLQRTKDEL